MLTVEWNILSKLGWGDGPWQREPDKKQWEDKETGYPCLIVRAPVTGALCGYVGIPKTHPAYGKHHDNIDVEVHGGLTYVDECDEEGLICHTPDDGEPDNVWWCGFDCAHYQDYTPAMTSHLAGIGLVALNNNTKTYKDISFVESECHKLAVQLKAMEE